MSVQLSELVYDRRLRDAARAVVNADLVHLRADIASKGVVERAVARVSARTSDVIDEASHFAAENKAVIAAVIGALALWFAREPLLDAVLGDERTL